MASPMSTATHSILQKRHGASVGGWRTLGPSTGWLIGSCICLCLASFLHSCAMFVVLCHLGVSFHLYVSDIAIPCNQYEHCVAILFKLLSIWVGSLPTVFAKQMHIFRLAGSMWGTPTPFRGTLAQSIARSSIFRAPWQP